MTVICTGPERPAIHPDRLLEEISAISRGGVHRLTPDEAYAQLGHLSHKINQLVDGIAMGSPLPEAFTRIHGVRAAAAKRVAESQGC